MWPSNAEKKVNNAGGRENKRKRKGGAEEEHFKEGNPWRKVHWICSQVSERISFCVLVNCVFKEKKTSLIIPQSSSVEKLVVFVFSVGLKQLQLFRAP